VGILEWSWQAHYGFSVIELDSSSKSSLRELAEL